MVEAVEAASGSESESTRERILDVAEVLFAERGLAGTAVRDIAREAGLTAPSLYNHFDGKQALYEAVLARGVEPLYSIMGGGGPATLEGARRDEAAQTTQAGETLDAIMDHLASHPNLAKLIQYESLTGGENLARIVHGWLEPIVSTGLAAMKANPNTVWSDDEQPLAVAAWIHVILGHFALAPLLRELFHVDPLAPEQIERQKQFLRRFAQLMMAGDDSGGSGSD
jgi:AcrR family transcriptional regulator